MPLHLVVVIAASAVAVLAGRIWSRRRARHAPATADRSVFAADVSVIGTLYAVLLAFVMVSVWEQFDTARTAADREASEMADLVRLTAGLPEPSSGRVRAAIRDYAAAVVDDEWNAMADGGRSQRADRALGDLWNTLIAADPRDDRGLAIYADALERLRSASDSRQDRLSQARPSVHAVIWVLLIGGGMLTLLATHYFGGASTADLPVNVGLTLMIAFMLFLIFAFDHPFSHDVGTDPHAMRAVLSTLGG